MKFPESPEDIKNEIIISADKYEEIGDLRIRQLIKILPNVHDELIDETGIEIQTTKSDFDRVVTDYMIR